MLSIQTVPLGSHHTILPLLAVAFLILATLLLLRLYALGLRARLLPRRPGHTEDSFVHHLAAVGLNPRIARTTYRYLQKDCNIRFPILMDDTLTSDLGLDRRAVRQATRVLFLQNGRELQVSTAREIVTVGDLVKSIQSSRRNETDLAA